MYTYLSLLLASAAVAPCLCAPLQVAAPGSLTPRDIVHARQEVTNVCIVDTLLVWNNGVFANFDTMSFTVNGKYSAKSVGGSDNRVWDGNNAGDATPSVSSEASLLPAFLIATYDHDRDWVQYNYGSQAWASNGEQCTDYQWQGNGPDPSRTISCTWQC